LGDVGPFSGDCIAMVSGVSPAPGCLEYGRAQKVGLGVALIGWEYRTAMKDAEILVEANQDGSARIYRLFFSLGELGWDWL